MGHASRLNELNLDLPPAPKPMGIYKPIVIVGDMAYLSGHGPLCSDGSLMSGCVGGDLDQADGYFAARQTGLAILSTLQQGLGSLDRVLRVVKILGMVHCVPQFDQHPAVIDGCSDLLAELFGSEHGIGARSAVGMSSLPGGMAVEIETVFQVRT